MNKKIKTIKNQISNGASIAQKIDHTNINRGATAEDIINTCNEAKQYGFRGVCVNPEWVSLAKEELGGTGVRVVVLIDPPMGQNPHQERIEMCKKAIAEGADDLDVVMNIVDLKYERYVEVLNDLKEICKIGPTKVIIGSGYLTDEEVRKASEIVRETGAVCVKTSTFKDPLDNFELKEKAKHLEIMKEAAQGLEIKAAGSIKTLADLEMMIEAGADIIGTSSGVEIMKERLKIKNQI